MAMMANARHRWFGAFFLALAGASLIWGQTWLKPCLTGVVFILYWLGCFLCTILALLFAWLDVRFIRNQVRSQQQALIQKAISELAEKSSNPTNAPTPKRRGRS